MEKIKTAISSVEFMNIKTSDVVTPKGNLDKDTIFKWSAIVNIFLLAILIFFLNGELAKTTTETMIERNDVSDASLNKVCLPMLLTGEEGVSNGVTSMKDSPLQSLENDSGGRGLSCGKPHCMKVSVGFCEYIENEWLSGKWKYAHNSENTVSEIGGFIKSCLVCGDTSAGSCGQGECEIEGRTSDDCPNYYVLVPDSTTYLSFDLAADEPTFSTSACDSNPYEEDLQPLQPSGTNILSVLMPVMLDDGYLSFASIQSSTGIWPNAPSEWTAVTKRASFLTDCEKDREAACANIEANSAPFSCTVTKHTSFAAAWGVAFATTQSIAAALLPLVVMVVVKKFGTPDAAKSGVKEVELTEKYTANPVV